ncbi:MAG TPA: protein kinase, partial [Pyrinomonadaceae bacterium]|nr:protein kinase [Pyrinomonadaceae bacterium]
MTPERLKQINHIIEGALERAPSERLAYLDAACAHDPALREEVESRINSREHAAERSRDASQARVGEATTSPRGDERAAPHEADEPPSAETQAEVVPGTTVFGAYRVLEKIGEGGMGTVYLAKDARLGRRVALKLLPAEFARDEELVRRFELEARAASVLNHPNIITVHEIGESEGRRFIVTEYVEGRTLRERLAEERFAANEALEICAQVAGALAKAHAAGVLHRDIKPENIMVDEDGHVKVLDFGIAKELTHAPSVDTDAPTSAHVNTAAGVILGTATYMSPEQVRGQELDARTDIWSLGVVLYEMVTGRAPFEAQTYGDLIVAILHDEPQPLADFSVELPEGFGRMLRRALSKEKQGRHTSATELRDELRRLRRQIEFHTETLHDEPSFDSRSDTSRSPTPREAGVRQRAAPRHQTTEQRKQLTVLFADFAGLAALTEGQDAEDVGELMSELWPLVDGVVAEHGGSVDRHVGEQFVALWGARGAQEDDPERAVRAALAVQEAVGDFFERRMPGVPAPREAGEGEEHAPLMRVGISTGLVLLGEGGATGGFTVTGDPVRLASRLQQSAPAGGVLISHDTYRHVRGVFSVHPPETLDTGGRADPVQFYRVKRAKAR